MCFELEDAKCSTLSIREYSMAVDLSSSLYSVHVDGSSSLYGPCCQISNMSIDYRHPYAPARGTTCQLPGLT